MPTARYSSGSATVEYERAVCGPTPFTADTRNYTGQLAARQDLQASVAALIRRLFKERVITSVTITKGKTVYFSLVRTNDAALHSFQRAFKAVNGQELRQPENPYAPPARGWAGGGGGSGSGPSGWPVDSGGDDSAYND